MLKLGLVGMGKMGMAHAGWIEHNKDMELVAVCDSNPAREQFLRQKYDTEFFTDYDQFLKYGPMDIIVVVTTNDAHERLTVQALASGRDVIVEKPMSLTFESARRMVQTAEKNGRRIFVHQSSRWDRDFLLIEEVIASGKIGDLLMIQSKVMLCDAGWPSWGIDGMKNPWRIKAAYGGGMLFDWGPHLVDQMLHLCGDPIGVFGQLQRGIWSKDVDDYFFAVFPYRNGMQFQIEVSNNSTLDMNRWFVIGTKGTFIVKGMHEPIWAKAELAYTSQNGKKVHEWLELEGVNESGMEGGFYDDLIPYLNHQTNDFITMDQAAKVIKVLEQIRLSDGERRFITFEEEADDQR